MSDLVHLTAMTRPGAAATPPGPAPGLMRLADLLGEWDAEALALYEAKQKGIARGPVTGLPKLDRELSGYLAPGMHIVHGAPGIGKTAFCLQLASGCGCPVLFVTCEMAPLELLRRLTARLTGTFLGKFKTGDLAPPEAGRLVRQAVAELPHVVLLDATQAYASATALLNAAETTRQTVPDNPHLLLIIDSLHAWADGAPAAPEYDRLNEHLSLLRQLSARLSCSILTVAERSRGSMDKGGLSAAAGSRKFEYGAESVLELGAEGDGKPDAQGEFPVALRLAKNRHGVPGKVVKLMFNGALQRYREV